jgi:hypothetical protein
MIGLRLYINPAVTVTPNGHDVFYSRRADGPYYRWWYEETLKHWRGARIHSTDFSPRALCAANLKVVPAALQTRLGEHYQE